MGIGVVVAVSVVAVSVVATAVSFDVAVEASVARADVNAAISATVAI